MRALAYAVALLALGCAGETFEIVEPEINEPVDPCVPVEVEVSIGETTLALAPTGDLSQCRRTECQNYITHRLIVPDGACALLLFAEGEEGPYRVARNETSSCGQATHPCSDVNAGEVVIFTGSDAVASSVTIVVEPVDENGECSLACG
jgi:hypothetical protein